MFLFLAVRLPRVVQLGERLSVHACVHVNDMQWCVR